MTHPLERIHLEPLWKLRGSLTRLVETRLWAKVLLGMFLGVGTGLLLGPDLGWVAPSISLPLANWLSLPGILFLALIQMIVVPLVFASVVRGIAASENVRELRSLGLGGALFFIVTSAFAAVLGIALGLGLRPGRFIDPDQVRAALVGPVAVPSERPDMPGLGELPQALVDLLPTNPLASMVGAEMLQVILFAVVIGIALVNLAPEKSAPLFDLLGSVQEVCMKVVGGAMRIAPFAVFGLVARLTSSVGIEVLGGLGVYMATVLLGLALLLTLFLAVAAVLGGVRPGAFLAGTRDVLLLAFSTSSSAAVMPLSIETAEKRLGVKASVARFLIPLGATANMNGTALYQGVATVFLAQVFEVPLTTPGLLFVVVTAVAASIGSPATPGMGIVILAMVVEGVGIPAAGIALLLGVDRLLDMSRTAVNVAGDLTACVVLDRLSAAREAGP